MIRSMQHAGYTSTRLDLPNGCSACLPRQNHASTRVPLIRKNCFGNPKVEKQRKDNNTRAEKQTQMHASKQIWWYPVFFWISSSKYSLVCVRVRGAPVCVCVCVIFVLHVMPYQTTGRCLRVIRQWSRTNIQLVSRVFLIPCLSSCSSSSFLGHFTCM